MKKTNNTFFLTLLIAFFLAGSSALSSAQEQAQQGVDNSETLPLIKIWDVTMNAPLDFPPCVSMLPMRSAEGGSCITLSDPKNVEPLPFVEYVDLISRIWYSNYDQDKPAPMLVAASAGTPVLGLDEQNRVVYLMTYTRADEESQEEVFAMLKGLFGEPVIDIVKDDRWKPSPFKEVSNDWRNSEEGGRIVFWNTDDVWVRYVFNMRNSSAGLLVVGLKRMLDTDSLIPPIYSY